MCYAPDMWLGLWLFGGLALGLLASFYRQTMKPPCLTAIAAFASVQNPDAFGCGEIYFVRRPGGLLHVHDYQVHVVGAGPCALECGEPSMRTVVQPSSQ